MLKNMAVKLPDVFLSLLVSFSITYALASGMYLTFPPGLMLLIVMSVMLALFIAFLNRTASIVSAVLLGMALVSSLVYALYAVDFNKLVEFLDGYFYWLIDFIKYPDVPDPTYQLITVIALCIFVSVLSYIRYQEIQFPCHTGGWRHHICCTGSIQGNRQYRSFLPFPGCSAYVVPQARLPCKIKNGSE